MKKIKAHIKTALKRYNFLYMFYFWIMSVLVNVIKLFIKTDSNLFLFVSYGGRRCTDSPKAIYEFMKNDSRFRNYKLVWGLINPNDYPEIDQKVKIDTIKYYIISLKARCWITNVLIERGLEYTGKNTFYLYTGHGSPIKKVGREVHNDKIFNSAAKSSFNACLAQSEFEKKIRSRIFSVPGKEVYMTGVPTNDILANYDDSYRMVIRNLLGIKENKKAILYAPTFREYRKFGTYDMPNVDFDRWHELLGNEFVILYRAHPISQAVSLGDKEWFIDVTEKDDIEPLMIASDILISDYSGLITDYSIMHKPIYLWTYDYDQFDRERGLYFDVRKVLPYAEREKSLLLMIKEGFTQEQKEMVIAFQKKYATVYGSGTLNAVNLIFEKTVNN